MNLIFDFDGTICDSLQELAKIAKKFLGENDLSTHSIKEVKEKGIKQIIKESRFPLYRIPSLVLKGRREIASKIPNLKSYPGMKTVLNKLSKKHMLGILTSNSKENVEKFLKNNDLDGTFDLIASEISLFGKDKSLKKIIKQHSLDTNETVYIGDEVRDIEAAKKTGIKAIAVTWGLESAQVLKKASPNLIINKPHLLLKLY